MTTFSNRFEYTIDQTNAYIRDLIHDREYVLPLQLVNAIAKQAKSMRLRQSNRV